MHPPAYDFCARVRDQFPEHFKDCRVLEVGSRYINGTVRTLFSRCEYTGLDLTWGPLVDRVCHVADFWSEVPMSCIFDTVISCEALEHDKRALESIAAMYELLLPGGLLVLTAAGTGRAEHGTHAHAPTDSPATLDHYENITMPMFWSATHPAKWARHEIRDEKGDFQFWGVKA